MSWRWLPILMISLWACESSERNSDFSGTYSGEGVTLQIDGAGPKHQGRLVVAGQEYVLVAKASGGKLTGSFEVDGESFTLAAVFDGAILELTSGGKTRRLHKEGSKSPAVASKDSEAANPLAALSKDSKDSASAHVSKEEPEAPTPTGFGGAFTGQIEGMETTIRLDVQGSVLTGVLDMDGYKYKLRGKVNGDKASGTLSDPQSGGASMKFRGKLRGERLVITMVVPGAPGVKIRFQRRGSAVATAGTNSSAPSAKPEKGAEHNPALVGTWSKTTSMGSGGASFSSKEYMRVFRDGRFQVGAGQAVAGGAGWSMGSDDGVEITGSGKWKTQGQNVLINEGSGWQAVGRFYIEGNRLMFTLPDGSREIWHRE